MWTLERAIAGAECVPAVMVCAAIGSTDETASNMPIARYFETKSFLYICEVSLVIKNRIFQTGVRKTPWIGSGGFRQKRKVTTVSTSPILTHRVRTGQTSCAG
jgi:hypothetical protein